MAADRPLNPWLVDSRVLPEDRPCTHCERVLPRDAYRTLRARGRFGKARRAPRCRECENTVRRQGRALAQQERGGD